MKIKNMFPEFRYFFFFLRDSNPHFSKIFEDHEQLDREISQLELDPVHQINDDIEALKRKKLRLKDEMYHLLLKAQNDQLA